MPASHHSIFYRPDALPANEPTALEADRQTIRKIKTHNRYKVGYK